MTSKRIADYRKRRISEIEGECRRIERTAGNVFDESLLDLHERYRKLRRELGVHLLARDKANRPHIHAKKGRCLVAG